MHNGGIRHSKEIELKPASDGKYLFVILQKNGHKKHFKVHRLVASHFVKNPNNNPIVNHIDGNKENNHYKNLEWVTYKENSLHAVNTGLIIYTNSGERSNLSVLSDKQAREIRDYYENGGTLTSREMAKVYSVDKSTILRIKNNKTFKNV